MTFPERARAGAVTPMNVPGHKQRQDLTGAVVVVGDVPLYGGLDTIKHAAALLAGAQRRAAGPWGAGPCPVSPPRAAPRQPAPAPAGGPPPRGGVPRPPPPPPPPPPPL